MTGLGVGQGARPQEMLQTLGSLVRYTRTRGIASKTLRRSVTLATRSNDATTTTTAPVFRATNADVYPFGVPSNDRKHAWFVNLDWTISSDSCWAILSPSSASSSSSSSTKSATDSRSNLVSTILHQARFDPIGSATHPILDELEPPTTTTTSTERERTVDNSIELVSFKTRLRQTGGHFQDYTARYYSIREEDQLTTREHFRQSRGGVGGHVDDVDRDISSLAETLDLVPQLDLPLITLSNGQTRRARILRALLSHPALLILEEPFTGLDHASRDTLASLLATLHARQSPRILLVLRPQDPLPDFVTHLAIVQDASRRPPPPLSLSHDPEKEGEGESGNDDAIGMRGAQQSRHSRGPAHVELGTKETILSTSDLAREMFHRGHLARIAANERRDRTRRELDEAKQKRTHEHESAGAGVGGDRERDDRDALVRLENVRVSYGRDDVPERRVLDGIDWTIRPGERWVLVGHNGSGKSTLLSIILGDHPRSFSEDVTLFGKPRYRQATSTIQENIGHVSPEIFNAFPRKHGDQGLTALDAIVTGFESIFSYRTPTAEQLNLVRTLIESFFPTTTCRRREQHVVDVDDAQEEENKALDKEGRRRREREEEEEEPRRSLEYWSTRLFAELTASEQALVLVWRALVKRPRLVVLDEPFQGMDLDTTRIVKRWFEPCATRYPRGERQQEQEQEQGGGLEEGQSVVLISHFEEEIPNGFDRRFELEHGRVKDVI